MSSAAFFSAPAAVLAEEDAAEAGTFSSCGILSAGAAPVVSGGAFVVSLAVVSLAVVSLAVVSLAVVSLSISDDCACACGTPSVESQAAHTAIRNACKLFLADTFIMLTS
jgi:hypothetical protein